MIKNKEQEPNKKTSQTIKRKYVAILPHLFTLSHCLKVAESKESEQRWRSEIRVRSFRAEVTLHPVPWSLMLEILACRSIPWQNKDLFSWGAHSTGAALR